MQLSDVQKDLVTRVLNLKDQNGKCIINDKDYFNDEI